MIVLVRRLKYLGHRLVRYLAYLAGWKIYKLVGNGPRYIDIKGLVDVRCLNYFLSKNNIKDIILTAKLDDARGLPAFTWGSNSRHPYVQAIKSVSALQNTELSNELLIKDILGNYYALVTPATAAAFLLLPSTHILENYPSWAVVMPWECASIEEWSAAVEKSVAYENVQCGSDATIVNGWAWSGPTDAIKCEIESIRLVRLLSSIQKSGYQRNDYDDGDIIANILVDEQGRWVWQTISGQHRAAVLSGLGIKECHFRVNSLIRREDAAFWPNVVNGLYTINEALMVFDRVFLGYSPGMSDEWENYVNSMEANP